MFNAVSELEVAVSKLLKRDYEYNICPQASTCKKIRYNFQLQREIMRAIMESTDSESIRDNKLIKLLEHVEGLRSSILVANLDVRANAQFTNLIEYIRRQVYELYAKYGSRKRTPRESRIFEESTRNIELKIHQIAGHIMSSGMKRLEQMNKWEVIAKSAKDYTKALGEVRKLGPVGGSEPPQFKAIMEGDTSILNIDVTEYNALRKQQEVQKNAQIAAMKDRKKIMKRGRVSNADGAP